MKIVLIEDSREKCRYIEEYARSLNIEMVRFSDLLSAINYIEEGNEIAGIITDKSYPIEEGEKENKVAGITLLEWLHGHNKKIPVLGNSLLKFDTQYSYYKGKMNGYFERTVFDKFIAEIKKHD